MDIPFKAFSSNVNRNAWTLSGQAQGLLRGSEQNADGTLEPVAGVVNLILSRY